MANTTNLSRGQKAAATRAATRAAKAAASHVEQPVAAECLDPKQATAKRMAEELFEAVAPAMETSMERLERIADEREIAEYEAGIATPEAPDTLEALVVADLLNNRGLLASGVTVEIKTGYVGPMVALRERAAQGAYRPAQNGQPCCGDAVAVKLGTLKPAQVIRACIVAMALPANPYLHLNIGQQSMNLRNKLRGCLKRGEFGMGVVLEAVEQIEEEVTA